jgi:hypothetical protein
MMTRFCVPSRSISAIASLALITLAGIASPALAVIDCDAAPDSPLCSGEPRPKPKPRPVPAPVPSSPIVQQVLARSGQIQQTIDTAWSEFGKGVLAQQIKDELNGKRVGKIVRTIHLKNVSVNLRDLAIKEVKAGPGANQISVHLVAPGNNVNASADVFALPDPSYRVFFDLELDLTLSLDNSSNPIRVDTFNARSTNLDVRGSNLVGTITKSIADFFTGGGFSRNITARATQSITKEQLAANIRAIADRFSVFAGL